MSRSTTHHESAANQMATVRLRAAAGSILAGILLAAAAVGDDSPPLDVTYRGPAGRIIGAALVNDHAYLRLSQLCDGIGHRLSGSKSLESAVLWAADAMRE